MNDIVDNLKENGDVQNNDNIRVSVTHPTLQFGVHIPFGTASKISGDSILSEIERVAQSNETFRFEEKGLKLEMTHTQMPNGKGVHKNDFMATLWN